MFDCPIVKSFYIFDESYDLIFKIDHIIELFKVFLDSKKFMDVSILLIDYDYKLDIIGLITEFYKIYENKLLEIQSTETIEYIHNDFVEDCIFSEENDLSSDDLITSIKCFFIGKLSSWYNNNNTKYTLTYEMIKYMDNDLKNQICSEALNNEINENIYEMCFDRYIKK